MSPACHGYVRVSSPRQEKEGLSMEAQEAKIRAYALDRNLGTPHFWMDGAELATTPFAERPAASALIDRLRPGDHVLITRIDRGFRNLADFLHWFDAWLQNGTMLHVLDFGGNTIDPRTSIGRLMYHMLASLAQWERDQISERCLAVTGYLRSQGLYHSPHVPFGFKAVANKNGKGFYAVPNPAEREIMGQIYEWWLGGKTHWAIFQHLRAHKVPLPNRKHKNKLKEWTWNYVQRLCAREAKLRAQEARGETA